MTIILFKLSPSGELAKASYDNYPVFNLNVPKSCSNVPSEVLNPSNVWASKSDYDKTVQKLAGLFQENFKSYASQATSDVISAGPK